MIDLDLQQRCEELITKGLQLVAQIRYFKGSPHYWYRDEEIADIQSWIASVGNYFRHASTYHKAGKKIESAVLASAVFEDTIRKISQKNDFSEKGKSLETIIDELTKMNIFTPVKAKRIKGYSAIRNKALHAQWDDFDIRDVGELIKGTRELIETYL